MSEITVGVLLLAGGVLFVLCTKIGKEFKIEKMDFALLLIPLLIWMVATGRIQKLTVRVLSAIAPWIENYVPISWIKNS